MVMMIGMRGGVTTILEYRPEARLRGRSSVSTVSSLFEVLERRRVSQFINYFETLLYAWQPTIPQTSEFSSRRGYCVSVHPHQIVL